MTRHTRSIAIALAALSVIVAAAACTPGGGVTTPSASDPITTPNTPTPTATPTPSKEELENRAAEQAVINFWAMTDKLFTDPNVSLSKLVTVARDESASNWRQLVRNRRIHGYTQTGSTVVRSVHTAKNKKGQWDATACVDVSKVNVVDKQGKSVVNAGRAPRVKYTYVLVRDNGKFYVIKDKAVGEC